MTPIETKLKELEKLDKAATPGPWVAVGYDSDICGPYNRIHEASGCSNIEIYADRKHKVTEDEENAVLMACYRNETPNLIAALREAVAGLDNLKRARERDKDGVTRLSIVDVSALADNTIYRIEKILNGGK